MFRKKQTAPSVRNVQRSPSANVFSYYSARSPAESANRRAEPAAVRLRRSRLGWLKYAPSLIAGAALIVCLVSISTLDVTPKIQAVSSQNARTIARSTAAYEDQAGDIFARSIFNRSKLLIDTDKVARELKAAFPELGEVSVILPLISRRPIIEVQPAKAALILAGSGGAYIVDQEGRAVIKANDVESSIRDQLPVVQDQSDIPITRGKGVLSKEAVSFIWQFTGQLAQKQIPLQSLTLPATANELHARIEGKPYYIKLDIQGEGRLQAGTFIAVKERLEGDGLVPGEYLDVRVPEKAFYK